MIRDYRRQPLPALYFVCGGGHKTRPPHTRPTTTNPVGFAHGWALGSSVQASPMLVFERIPDGAQFYVLHGLLWQVEMQSPPPPAPMTEVPPEEEV